MKILKYFSGLLIVAFSLFVSSCKLDEDLLGTPSPELVKSEEDITALVNGAYSRFNDAAAFKFQGMMMLMLMADDLYSPDGSEFGVYGQRTLSAGNTASFWNQFYFSIASANDLIKTLENVDLPEAFEKRVYGEAHFLRAFSYYYLVRLYGGVPLRLDATDVNSNFYLPRSSVDEVYAQIFRDFKVASSNLPLANQIGAGELGRASKGAAQALLAQASLTYGNQLSLKGQDPTTPYTEAVLYADSVISSNQYVLIDNLADVFDINKEAAAYKEVIFGIRFQVDNQNRAQPAAGSEFALRFMVPATTGVTGRANTSGAGNIRPMPWIADFYRTGDYKSTVDNTIDFRNEVSFYQKGKNAAGSEVVTYPNIPTSSQANVATPVVGKYIDPAGKDERNHGNDFFVIRYSDVYLTKAEALNELFGPTNAEAINAFNTVRARARKANGIPRPVPADVPISNTLTKSEFRLKIFHDRGLEFLGEGQRWFDLVRMQHPTNPSKTMYEYQFLEELSNTTKYSRTLPAWRVPQRVWSTRFAVYAPTLNVTIPKFLLFPIPTTEIINNPAVGPQNQNPGW